MLTVQYAGEVSDLDRPAYEAEAERGDKPIRVRVQPMLLKTSGEYAAWKGVAWSVGCESAAEAIQLRKTLEAFFTAVGRYGLQQVTDVLTPEEPKE